MVVIVAGFIFIINKNTKNITAIVSAEESRISNLINELGETKEELNQLSLNQNKISVLYEELETTQEQIANLSKGIIESIKEKESNWEAVQNELKETQNQMATMLSEKEAIISSLTTKNELLRKELNLPPIDPSIESILLVGHNGNLADTIILANIVPATQKIVLISIPRDLYYNGRKINSLYSNYGISELQRAVNEITGIYPDKFIVFNFTSFIDIIDFLGGVTVDVQNRLEDNAYPGPDNSYTTVIFEKGSQKMDGQTALKYARSRKSTSDFNRAERQQQIISAVRKEAMELDLLYKMDLATKIYAKVINEIETNIGLFDGLAIVQDCQNYEINTENVLSTQNYLYSTLNAAGSYILLPHGGHYLDIKTYIRDLLL